MIDPWLTLPVKDVRLSLPLSMKDTEIRILFRDAKTIDNAIEQLQDLKAIIGDRRIFMDDQ